jgi:uncharacterized protein (DUF1697 family)
MALVVLLKGLNVGGHRTLRPTALAEQLRHLDIVNIGAAGTFVVRRSVSASWLRDDVARRLPFDSEIAVCQGREMIALLSRDPFADIPASTDSVRFVSVLSRAPRSIPPLPFWLPVRGKWLLQVVGRDGRFVFGLYRRHMKVISYLRDLDRLFGAPDITRNWKTIGQITKVLTET